MIGAIAGDIIGSIYEGAGTKTKRFPLFGPYNRFTDDTVLTVAVAESILLESDLVAALHDYFHRYPQAGDELLIQAGAVHSARNIGSAMAVRGSFLY